MKSLSLIPILVVSLFIMSCGSAERGVVSGSNTTNVVINLGQRETHSVSSSGTISSSYIKADFESSSGIPSYITTVQCIVTNGAGGEVLLDTTVGSSVTLNLNVPNGSNRVFTVNAYTTVGYLYYRGSATADLTGAPVTLQIIMEYAYSSP